MPEGSGLMNDARHHRYSRLAKMRSDVLTLPRYQADSFNLTITSFEPQYTGRLRKGPILFLAPVSPNEDLCEISAR